MIRLRIDIDRKVKIKMDRIDNILQERQKRIDIIIKGQLWIER